MAVTLWIATIVLTLITIIVALAVAGENNADTARGSRGAGFAAIWSTGMAMVFSIFGTLIMRRLCARHARRT